MDLACASFAIRGNWGVGEPPAVWIGFGYCFVRLMMDMRESRGQIGLRSIVDWNGGCRHGVLHRAKLCGAAIIDKKNTWLHCPCFFFFLLFRNLTPSTFLILSLARTVPQFPPSILNMGRQKQTAPLQRTPSSNLMHLPNDSDVSRKPGNTDTPSVANGSVSGKASAALETVADSPGLMQLVICVLGIYAAL